MDSNLEPVPITSQKHDPAWKHCQMFKNGDRVQLKCVYCSKFFKGGGIHRIKEHLAGQKGNASTCLRVPSDVRLMMQQSLDGVVVKKRKKQKISDEVMNLNPVVLNEVESFANDHIEVNNGEELLGALNVIEPSSSLLVAQEGRTSTRDGERKKRGRGKGCGTNANTNATITMNDKLALGAQKANEHVHIAVGRFLCDIGASLDAVNSVYFRPMVGAIASGGFMVGVPSYHDLRGWILKNLVEEVKTDVEKYTATWARTGCSILVEQRSTSMGRTLLIFLVHCPEGVVFLKSVDASDIINSTDALYELLKQVVEEVGVRHVLQVITSTEEQYLVAGRRLSSTFPSLYCAPCAAHCVDLIFQDFAKLPWINATIEHARSITRFVYNHSVVLNMMRRYTRGNDIVEPGLTSSATNFLTLKRMADLKRDLEAMVFSQEWVDCLYSKKPGGLEMLDLISDHSFWSSCNLITHITNPFLRLLKIISCHKRPAVGYVYAGIYHAKEAIKKKLVKRDDYLVYWDIVDYRWEQQSNLPLYVAGFFLNPKFFYSVEGDIQGDILSGMIDCIEKLVLDADIQDKISKEINSYKSAAGDFGRKMALRARDTLLPAEWWSTYGGSCPNLARLAVRILSQTCSSLGYKRNQIPIERIYDTSNCLERQRLSDLLFVQYNLQLKQMVGTTNQEQNPIDPISVDNISTLENWIRGKDLSPEDYANLDWMALDPPSSTTWINDEVEELDLGFDDREIFSRMKVSKEENTEDDQQDNFSSKHFI